MKQQDWTEQLRQRLADHKEPVPEDLWADIERRVTPAKPARRVALRRWLAAAAACGLVLVGLWKWADKPATHQGMVSAPEQELVAEAIQAPTAEPVASAPEAPTPAPILKRRKSAAQKEVIAQAQDTIQEEGATAQYQTTQSAKEENMVRLPSGSGNGGRGSNPRDAVPSPVRSSTRRTPVLSLHATNLLAYGGTSEVEPVEMASSYMGPASQMLARSTKVYLANHDETTDHKMPLTVGLSLRLPLADRWWLASGVNYSRVASSFTHRTSTIVQVNHQRLHYVGVPLSAGYSFWQAPRLSAYASVGGEAQLNVKAQVDHGHLDRDRMQFSLLAAAGLEYKLLPQLSLFAQPGLRYYPDNGSAVQNIFKEHPLQLDLQLGVRYTLR